MTIKNSFWPYYNREDLNGKMKLLRCCKTSCHIGMHLRTRCLHSSVTWTIKLTYIPVVVLHEDHQIRTHFSYPNYIIDLNIEGLQTLLYTKALAPWAKTTQIALAIGHVPSQMCCILKPLLKANQRALSQGMKKWVAISCPIVKTTIINMNVVIFSRTTKFYLQSSYKSRYASLGLHYWNKYLAIK